ncbi:hypothetical protein [Streptomyces sp. NPDC008150]|uniref:hypothetical protein n=1 Tax=Streptomyces sp. NPDC008150 TaxID=3364816 RepID=UPI0036EBAFD8
MPVVVVGGAVLLLMPGMAFGEPPVPDGRPLVLPSGAFTGTWRDEDGGRLVLRADGTFASDGTCGDFSGPGLTDALSPAPGAGTWSASGTNADVPVTRVQVGFAPGGVWTVYEARGTAERPVLWQHLGDPDDGALCVLSRAGT